MNNTTRFTHLLGECRRQMNGAVVGSMRYYGAEYGLNYGVSLPTLRALAQAEGKDHSFAKYLYLQQVREIRLISFHIACAEAVDSSELDFWAEGIINSELAEEAAFALFQYVECAKKWLSSDNELLIYTAFLAIAKNRNLNLLDLKEHINKAITFDSVLLTSATITLLESYYREEKWRECVNTILNSLPEGGRTAHIIEEMEWRIELL